MGRLWAGGLNSYRTRAVWDVNVREINAYILLEALGAPGGFHVVEGGSDDFQEIADFGSWVYR